MKQLSPATVLAAALMCLPLAGTAWRPVSVGKKAEINVDPKMMNEERERLWKQFGGFCAIKDWHPAVANCEESKEATTTFRTLTLQGRRNEEAAGPEGLPLPLRDCRRPLAGEELPVAVRPDAGRRRRGRDQLRLVGRIDADGKPDKEVAQPRGQRLQSRPGEHQGHDRQQGRRQKTDPRRRFRIESRARKRGSFAFGHAAATKAVAGVCDTRYDGLMTNDAPSFEIFLISVPGFEPTVRGRSLWLPASSTAKVVKGGVTLPGGWLDV